MKSLQDEVNEILNIQKDNYGIIRDVQTSIIEQLHLLQPKEEDQFEVRQGENICLIEIKSYND